MPEERPMFETVARAGRGALRSIWERRETPAALIPPERKLLELMRRHPEYRPFWDGAEPDEGENPFLHVMMHRMVEEQIDQGDPPEARAAYERCVAAGGDPHDALHEIIQAFGLALHRMAETRGALDREEYVKSLDRCGKKDVAGEDARPSGEE